MTASGATIAFLLVVLSASRAAAEEALDGLRDDVRTAPAPASGPQRACEPDVFDDQSDVWISGEFLAFVLFSPFWGPHLALGDRFEREGFFPPFPYEGVRGDMYIDPGVVTDKHRRWMGHFRGEYANDFGGLDRFAGQLLLDSCLRLGIDTEANLRREELPCGCHDGLWNGDFNFVYRFAQSDRVQMRSGLGFNWLADNSQSDFGFNFTYGADLYPIRPLVLSAAIDWGNLRHAEMFHARASVGLVWRRWETYVGYDYYDVDSVQINGLAGGVGIWF